jgi:hypothetical protein
MTTLETLRPSITDHDYLDRLYDMGIFEKKLDVWAYCAAYALGKGLQAAQEDGSQMGSDLVHLDQSILRTLVTAIRAKSEGDLSDNKTILHRLSAYANSGMDEIRQQTVGKSRSEVYEFLLGQIEI